MTSYLQRKLFSVAEDYQLAKVGILKESDRVELINGEILATSPINSLHGGMVNRLTRILYKLLEDQLIITVQNPITLDNYSEPEPDLVVAKFDPDDYAKKHPRPTDVLLVIEVADSTLEKDRSVKCPLYAKAGIKEYWIVDLVNKKIEIYREPVEDEYHFKQVISKKDQIVTAEFTDLNIPYQNFFPK